MLDRLDRLNMGCPSMGRPLALAGDLRHRPGQMMPALAFVGTKLMVGHYIDSGGVLEITLSA